MSNKKRIAIDAMGGDGGVALTKWSVIRDCIGPEELYKMAVFRHIEFERTDENIANL